MSTRLKIKVEASSSPVESGDDVSANFVSRTLIDALMTAVIQYGEVHYWWHWNPDGPGGESVTRDNVASKGQMLWATNFRAVTGGMEAEDVEEWLGFSTLPDYRFEELPGAADPVVVLRLIACYGYQTFNDPWTYLTGEAYALTQALQAKTVKQIVDKREGLPWLPRDDQRDLFVREH